MMNFSAKGALLETITRKHAVVRLLAILVIAAAVRIHLAMTASVISRDGVQYVSMARDMADDWRAGIPPQLHFGYPLLIRLTHAAVGPFLAADSLMQWQRAGQLVSLMGGLCCIPLIYLLGLRLFSRRVGLLSAFVWALLPYAARFSADALSDMPHLALVLAGLLFIMSGMSTRRWPHWFLAGLFGGAAYCIRPEGGEVAFIAVVIALCAPRLGPLPRRLIACVAIVCGFSLLGGVYSIAEGRLFSKHLSIFSTVNRPVPVLAGVGSVPAAMLELINELTQTLHGVWLLLAIAWRFMPAKPALRSRRIIAPLLLLTLHAAILVWLHTVRDYISSRHVVLLDVGFVIFACASLVRLQTWLARRSTSSSGLVRRFDLHAAVVLSLATSPWLLADINESRHYIHTAAAWLREHGGDSPHIVSENGWVPFYAGLRRWDVCAKAEELPTHAQLAAADWLIYDVRHVPPAQMTVEPSTVVSLVEEMRFTDQKGSRGVVIYRVARRGQEPVACAPGSDHAPSSGARRLRAGFLTLGVVGGPSLALRVLISRCLPASSRASPENME